MSVHPPALTPGYRSTLLRAPSQPPIRFDPTPLETTGPTFGHLAPSPLEADLLANHAAPGEAPIGPRIVIEGRLTDDAGRGIEGALVEVWQANAAGRYRHARDGYHLAPLDPNFGGCGRALTGEGGAYRFLSVRPGPYPFPNGDAPAWRPAHVHFSVFGHAFEQRLVTQMYFEGDPMLAHCPIVGTLPGPDAVEALTARLDVAASAPFDALVWRFDIRLRATPFERAA